MAWEVGIQLSIYGTAFLLAYIAFNIEVISVEDQFLRLLLIAFAIIFAFAGVGANFGILDSSGISFTDSSKLMSNLNSVYIPFIVLLVLLLVYTVYFVVKQIYHHVKEAANIKGGFKEKDEED